MIQTSLGAASAIVSFELSELRVREPASVAVPESRRKPPAGAWRRDVAEVYSRVSYDVGTAARALAFSINSPTTTTMAQTEQFMKANERYVASFSKGDLPMPPARKVAAVVRARSHYTPALCARAEGCAIGSELARSCTAVNAPRKSRNTRQCH